MIVVFDFNASLNDCAPVPPILFSVDVMIMKKIGLLMDVICVLFLLSSPPRPSFVSVMFDFSASLNDFAHLAPMLFSVDLMRMEECVVGGCHLCVISFLCSPSRLSSVSVVFDFNTSLNDVAPLSLILFPVDVMRMEKSGLLMDFICVLFLFCSHYPDRVS